MGSTGSAGLILLVNLFIGLSVGTNVLVAQYVGARQVKEVHETVHTAVLISVVGGIVMIFVGLIFAAPLLEIMGTPEDVLDQAVLYVRIYFLGMPVLMLYNFGSAVLRAIGDTKHPLYYLLIAGAINIAFNLFFVIVFNMGVAGVAIATVISETISAVLVTVCLCRSDSMCKLHLSQLRIHVDKLLSMMRIGIPAGLQGMVFSLSNVVIQSSINSFGSIAMAGNTAASNIEGFVYVSMNSIYQTSLSFTSQNYGAKNYRRIDRTLLQCEAIVGVIGLVLGIGAFLLGDPLLHFYTTDPEVITYGIARLSVVSASYVLCGMMDVFTGSIRGLGYSILPMIVSLTGACAFRILWIFTIFQYERTLFCLYLSYPISWLLTAATHFTCYLVIRRKKFPKSLSHEETAQVDA